MRSFRLKTNIAGTATFRVHFGEYFDDVLPSQGQNPCDPESTESAANEENQKPPQELDVLRFPIISSDEIHELKSITSNKNTSRSTKQWMNVSRSWCECHHLEYVSIEIMAPEKLDKVLSNFYAEVKKKDGDDYEPESLNIMQSAIKRYLKEKNYPLSIVQSREFHSSQVILNARTISLRQQGKGKRPNKAQPITPEEELALWEKGQLGDLNGKVLANVNFKNLTQQLRFRGRQEHYDAYVEDVIIRQRKDGTEVV